MRPSLQELINSFKQENDFIETETKQCTKCKKVKKISLFYRRSDIALDKYSTYSWCITCHSKHSSKVFEKKTIGMGLKYCKTCNRKRLLSDFDNLQKKECRNCEQIRTACKTKVCTKCGKEKNIIEFHRAKRNKDGLRNHCKECTNKEQLALINKRAKDLSKRTHKVCFKCETLLPLNMFYKRTASVDGYGSECKECSSTRVKSISRKRT